MMSQPNPNQTGLLVCKAGKAKFMKTILQVEDDPNDVFFFQHAMDKLGSPIPCRSSATDSRPLTI